VTSLEARIERTRETKAAPQYVSLKDRTFTPAASIEQLLQNLNQERQGVPTVSAEASAPAPPYAPLVQLQEQAHHVARRWSGIVKDVIIEGDWQAANIARPAVAQGNRARYEQHDWKILQQAKRTVAEHGVKSEAARIILDWLYTAAVTCPFDSQNVARFLLTPSQLLSWEREWKRLAVIEANRPRDPNDPLRGINPEMLIGAGPHQNIGVQLECPLEIRHLSGQLARQAYNAVADSKPQPIFTSVKQGLNEPYCHFIDRLWQAVADQNDMSEEVKQSMFKFLAFENANQRTRPILATLPKSAEVSEMLEITDRAALQNQGQVVANAVAQAMKPTASLLAAAVQKLQGKPASKAASVCFR
ncbi:GAK9 protein, partial [Pomatostomus ruficeps]|nr:GAK9 protein [Pomatostomus ruficeps]